MIARRLSLAARVLAVTLGAYGAASLLAAALSLLLVWVGLSRPEAVMAATLASFAVYALLAIAVFHARSTVRAWVGLLLVAAPASLLILMSGVPVTE